MFEKILLKLKNKIEMKKGMDILTEQKPVLICKGESRSLYKLPSGDVLWLNSEKYLDACIIKSGVFEEDSTRVVEKIIKNGDIVLDIGANIGYYTVMFSRLIGEDGKVIAFEPTKHYRNVLEKNIAENKITNCVIMDYGLSDETQQAEISIGDCSATMHWASDSTPASKETIQLFTLDEIFKDLDVQKIDFIKIDVDGHEPKFFEGAWKTLEKYDPTIILEVNQENYLNANVTAWDFYDMLKEKGYYIYDENQLKQFNSKREFLIRCGNFAYSANIIISKKELI